MARSKTTLRNECATKRQRSASGPALDSAIPHHRTTRNGQRIHARPAPSTLASLSRRPPAGDDAGTEEFRGFRASLPGPALQLRWVDAVLVTTTARYRHAVHPHPCRCHAGAAFDDHAGGSRRPGDRTAPGDGSGLRMLRPAWSSRWTRTRCGTGSNRSRRWTTGTRCWHPSMDRVNSRERRE